MPRTIPPTASHSPRRRHRTGMTLRDYVVAIGIIGLLLLLLLPWLVQSRGMSRRDLCEYRLRQVYIAASLYHVDFQQLPYYRSQSEGAWRDQPAQSWMATILSRVNRPDGNYPIEGLKTSERRRIPEILCPDRPLDDSEDRPRMSYVINCGQLDAKTPPPIPPDRLASGVSFDGMIGNPAARVQLSLPQLETLDGADYTLLLSENLGAGLIIDTRETQVGFLWSPWLMKSPPAGIQRIEPINGRRGEEDGSPAFARPSSLHGAGVNVAFCSGRLQWIDEKIDELVWERLMTSDDQSLVDPGTGEPLGEPYRGE